MATVAQPQAVTRAPSELGRVTRSEWTKLRSVRSTYWSLLATAFATVGIAAIACSFYVGRYAHLSAHERAHFNPTDFSLNGMRLAQLAIGVLGALVITSEYGTGMIRTTLAAVPQRRLVLAAKALVFAATAFVVGTIGSFAAYFVGQAILSGKHLESTISDPHVLRAVIGGGLYLTVIGLLALGLGAIVRHTAGAIASLFGLMLVLPGLMNALPQSWQDAATKYLPSEAGRQIFSVRHEAHMLSPWPGFGVFCIYAAVALVIGAVLIHRRDA